jgi:putative transposase
LFTAGLPGGTQACVLAVIEHATRRIRILGVTLHPSGEWTAQQARDLITGLGGQAHRAKLMIRDRGPNFSAASDMVPAEAGIGTVRCNVATPRVNAIAERWIGGCRRELLDRTLIWNQAHLRQILRLYQTHHNQHRPHRSPDGAARSNRYRTGRSRAVLRPKTRPRRRHDQRISPGRVTWMRFSALTAPVPASAP